MSSEPRDRKLEFLVTVAVIGALIALLLEGLAMTQRWMEEAKAEHEIAAQRIELLDRLAHREAVGGRLPAGGNPVAWTGRIPPRYLGEVDADEAVAEGGVWFYRRGAGVLVYRFQAGDEWHYRVVRGGHRDGIAIVGGVGLLRVDSGKATGNAVGASSR